MTSLVAFVGFVGFLCAGITVCVVRRRAKSEEWTQSATSAFLAYILLVSFTAGISQRDLWPFSSWQLMVGDASPRVGSSPDPAVLRIVGVDAVGEEHRVDYRSWQPFAPDDLSSWLILRFPGLSTAEQDVVGEYLLGLANEGRRAASSGSRPGSSERWWGPLATPYHLAHPRLWSEPERVPHLDFEVLRFYREYYGLEAFHRGEPIRLELTYEFRSGPR